MRRFTVVVLLGVLSGCGGSKNPPPKGGSVETIRGSERIGWDQQATNPAELATFRYAIYVDGVRQELNGASCTPPAGTAGYPCSARLPPLAQGEHTLELAAYVIGDGTISESPRSAALRVVVSAASSASAQAPAASTSSAAPGPGEVEPGTTAIADQLDDPTDLAFAPDGRLFIAERKGLLRTVRNGTLESSSALTLANITFNGDDGGLLGVAVHPEFERTRHIYVLHTVEGSSGERVFRVARFRDAGGRFGERAVLIDGIPAAPVRSSGAIRFGPDGALYVALDNGGEPGRARNAASFNGKVLRLNSDGTTPADQPAGSPVYASGYASPCALEWRPDTGLLWVADCGATSRLAAVPVRGGVRLRDTEVAQAPLQRARLRGATFYRGDLIPEWRDQLLIAADEGLFRVRVDARNRARIDGIEAVDPELRPVRAIASGRDGALYVCTRTTLLRLTALP